MSVVDHVNVPVADLARARRFYRVILEPLGYRFVMQDGRAVGFGVDRWSFGLVETAPPFSRLHLAFVATDRSRVDAFFEAAVREGAQVNGEPGLRSHYAPGYYAAFVLDPDGHNVEAVCRGAR